MIPMQNFIVQYWVEWLFGIVCGALAVGYKQLASKMKKQHAEDKAVKDGLLALLHDRLYQACTFSLARGYTDAELLKNAEYMYNAYHALGGNGTGTTLYEKMKALPIKEEQPEKTAKSETAL